MRRSIPLFALVALTGCKQVEPAPKELVALMHFFFTDIEDAEDEQMAEAFRNFDDVVGGADFAADDGAPERGSVDLLSKDAVDSTGYTHADPSNTAGLYVVGPVRCTMDQMIDLVTMKDQISVYGTYETFDREYTGDVAGFKKQDALAADWADNFHYKNGLLGIDYVADTTTVARWIPEIDDETTPWGPMLITRRSMIEPATNEKDDHSYPQDWRAEIYYERSPGNIVHLQAMWREADFGGLTQDDDLAQNTMLKGLEDWDKDSTSHCEGR